VSEENDTDGVRQPKIHGDSEKRDEREYLESHANSMGSTRSKWMVNGE